MCACMCGTKYMRFYTAMPTRCLRVITVIHIFYFGKSTIFWLYSNVFLALHHLLPWSNNRHQTLPIFFLFSLFIINYKNTVH